MLRNLWSHGYPLRWWCFNCWKADFIFKIISQTLSFCLTNRLSRAWTQNSCNWLNFHTRCMSRSFVSGFGEPVATEDPEGYYHLSLWRLSRNDTSETKEAACLIVLHIEWLFRLGEIYLYLRNYIHISMLSLLDTWYSAIAYRLWTYLTFSYIYSEPI